MPQSIATPGTVLLIADLLHKNSTSLSDIGSPVLALLADGLNTDIDAVEGVVDSILDNIDPNNTRTWVGSTPSGYHVLMLPHPAGFDSVYFGAGKTPLDAKLRLLQDYGAL